MRVFQPDNNEFEGGPHKSKSGGKAFIRLPEWRSQMLEVISTTQSATKKVSYLFYYFYMAEQNKLSFSVRHKKIYS